MFMEDGEAEALPPGARFGSYEVRRQVGRGGAGIVYEAEHVELGRRVALKTRHARVAHDTTAAERLRREARTLCKLRHEGLVEVIDLGVEDHTPFMVMEYLEGQSLAALLESGPLPVERAVDLALATLAALAVVHEAGVVHRDIKPSNLFVTDTRTGPRLKLVDFGLCAVLDETSSLTRTGGFVGTPHYAAPELLDGGRPIDRRVDLYGVALVLYECVTGRRAFTEDRMLALVGAIARGVRTPPRELAPELPPALDAVILRGCALDPDDRFATADEFARALVPFASPAERHAWETEAQPPTEPAPETPPREVNSTTTAPRRSGWTIARVVAVALVTAVAAIVVRARWSEEARPAPVVTAIVTTRERAPVAVVERAPEPPAVVARVEDAAVVARPPASRPVARHVSHRAHAPRGARDGGGLPVRDPSAIFGDSP
jgi:serine/threonine-protein kinase